MARQKLRPMPETKIINRVDSTCCNQLSLFTINIAHHVYNNHVVITSLEINDCDKYWLTTLSLRPRDLSFPPTLLCTELHVLTIFAPNVTWILNGPVFKFERQYCRCLFRFAAIRCDTIHRSTELELVKCRVVVASP